MKRMKKMISVLFLAIFVMFSAEVLIANARELPTVQLEKSCEHAKVLVDGHIKIDFLVKKTDDSQHLELNIYKGKGTSSENKVADGWALLNALEIGKQGVRTMQLNAGQLDFEVGTYTLEYWIKYDDPYNTGVKYNTAKKTSTFYVVRDTCGGNHKLGSQLFVRKKSNCKEQGEAAHNCTKCGIRLAKALPLGDHTWWNPTRVESTCETQGYIRHYCKVCIVANKTEYLPLKPHTYGNGVVYREPTCRTDGIMVYTCTGCFEAKKQEAIPAVHTWDQGVVREEPTVSNPGIKDCRCVKCGDSGEVKILPIFSDVYNDWYTSYVQYVYDETLMTGIKGTTKFEPLGNITKAQVAQVLYNMEGQPAVTNNGVFYDLQDVYLSEWYAKAVAWAYNNGIVTGDLNTRKFSPNANVTREQLALMMFRYADYKGYNTEKRDSLAGLKNRENVSNWARDAVEWAVGVELISGVEKNGVKDLQPRGSATRAQMAAILMRFDSNVINAPTPEPTPEPTAAPTAEPTPEPTAVPTPQPTAEPTPEEPKTKAEELAEYIEKNGSLYVLSGDVYRQIATELVMGDYLLDVSIINRKDINSLYFKWEIDTVGIEISFTYDLESQKASTPLYYSVGNSLKLETKENFDIASYTLDTVLDFKVVKNQFGTMTDEEAKGTGNSFAPAAVDCWRILLEEESEVTLQDLGFVSFVEPQTVEVNAVSETLADACFNGI